MKSMIQKLTRNKRRLLIAGMVGAIAVFLIPHLAFAQEAPAAAPSTQSANELYQQMVEFLILVMEFLQRLIWPVLLMIGGLLKNDLLFSAGMEQVMLSIWENIRNIVNILFVLILLGIAFYNVVGGSSQDYHIKSVLPRFVIALIAVNFSFLGVKVVLDGVNVVSTAIFALPGAVEKSLSENKAPNFQQKVCEGIYGKDDNTYFQAIEAAKTAANDNPDAAPLCEQDKTFTQKAQGFFTRFDSHNAAIVLAINLQEIHGLDVVKVGTPSAKNLAINVLFSIVLYVVYAVSFVALLIILLVRLVVLWVTMVMSPLIALAFVLPESLKSSLGSGGDLKTQFVKNAIVPIPVALTMSIGFIMLQSLKQARFSNVSLDTSVLGVNLLTSGLSTLQDLIVAVGTVAIIWIGVFKAAEGTAAQSIVEKIKGATEGFGKFVATAPFKYAPIVPIKEGGEKVSLGTALGVMREIPYGLERKQQEEASRIAGRYSGAALEETGKKLEGAKNPKEFMQEIINSSRGQEGSRQYQATLGETLRKKNPTFIGQFDWKPLEKYGKPNEIIEKLRKGEISEEDLRKWIETNSTKLRVSPQTTPSTPGGTAGQHPAGSGAPAPTGAAPQTPAQPGAEKAAAAVVGFGAASALVGAANLDKRKGALSEKQQKALDAYKADTTKLADTEVQEALKEVQGIDEGSKKFATDMSGAMAMEDKEKQDKQVIKIVLDRKQEVRTRIKNNNPNLDEKEVEKRVNEIVQDEMDQAPPGIRRDVSEVKAEKT